MNLHKLLLYNPKLSDITSSKLNRFVTGGVEGWTKSCCNTFGWGDVRGERPNKLR